MAVTIGLLGYAHDDEEGPNREFFLDELEKKGWIKDDGGDNGFSLILDHRKDPGWTPDNITQRMIDDNPTIVVVSGSNYVRLLLQKGATMPIVMAPATGDPKKTIASPLPGNVTGISLYRQNIVVERLHQLHHRLPDDHNRIATLRHTSPVVAQDSEEDETETRKNLPKLWKVGDAHPQWAWQGVSGGTPPDIEPKLVAEFDEIDEDKRPHGVVVISDFPAYWPHNRAEIIRAVKQNAAGSIERLLPAMYANRIYVEEGGLMSYGPNSEQVFRRVAYFVDEVLQKKPIPPVETPDNSWYELVINLDVVEYLKDGGVTINKGKVDGKEPDALIRTKSPAARRLPPVDQRRIPQPT